MDTPPTIVDWKTRNDFFFDLTRCQRQIVKYTVVECLNNHEIAAKLCISAGVVAGHLTAVYDRLSQLGGPLSEEPLDRPMFLPFSMTSAPLPPWPPPVAATSDL